MIHFFKYSFTWSQKQTSKSKTLAIEVKMGRLTPSYFTWFLSPFFFKAMLFNSILTNFFSIVNFTVKDSREKCLKKGATLIFKKYFHPYFSVLAQSASSPKRKKQHKKYRSVISDVFDGTIISSVQCLTCDRVSMKEL